MIVLTSTLVPQTPTIGDPQIYCNDNDMTMSLVDITWMVCHWVFIITIQLKYMCFHFI